jgi:predicted nucleotidyltransferase component of viral defense system
MLQTNAVEPKLLELLTGLMQQEEFKNFVLVGGTSLALQMGHRVSVDIDLFGMEEINEPLFIEVLEKYGKVNILKKSKNILITAVNGVKVDFVNYKYPLLDNYTITNSIRLASLKDIAAMKMNAIAGRGSKKDFIDLFYLLKAYSLEQIISFYIQKFPNGSEFMLRKSLTYFDDADLEETPVLLQYIDWSAIKSHLLGSM